MNSRSARPVGADSEQRPAVVDQAHPVVRDQQRRQVPGVGQPDRSGHRVQREQADRGRLAGQQQAEQPVEPAPAPRRAGARRRRTRAGRAAARPSRSRRATSGRPRRRSPSAAARRSRSARRSRRRPRPACWPARTARRCPPPAGPAAGAATGCAGASPRSGAPRRTTVAPRPPPPPPGRAGGARARRQRNAAPTPSRRPASGPRAASRRPPRAAVPLGQSTSGHRAASSGAHGRADRRGCRRPGATADLGGGLRPAGTDAASAAPRPSSPPPPPDRGRSGPRRRRPPAAASAGRSPSSPAGWSRRAGSAARPAVPPVAAPGSTAAGRAPRRPVPRGRSARPGSRPLPVEPLRAVGRVDGVRRDVDDRKAAAYRLSSLICSHTSKPVRSGSRTSRMTTSTFLGIEAVQRLGPGRRLDHLEPGPDEPLTSRYRLVLLSSTTSTTGGVLTPAPGSGGVAPLAGPPRPSSALLGDLLHRVSRTAEFGAVRPRTLASPGGRYLRATTISDGVGTHCVSPPGGVPFDRTEVRECR